jgi:hypothetical protein
LGGGCAVVGWRLETVLVSRMWTHPLFPPTSSRRMWRYRHSVVERWLSGGVQVLGTSTRDGRPDHGERTRLIRFTADRDAS